MDDRTDGIEPLQKRQNRLLTELKAYRSAQVETWGDIDDQMLARYIAGQCTDEERLRLEATARQFPAVREAIEVVSTALMPTAETSGLEKQLTDHAAPLHLAGVGSREDTEPSSASPMAFSEAKKLRSWSADPDCGYERLTDEKSQLIVIKFTKKPAAQIVEQLNVAGFRHQPEYLDQREVWLRRNDFEGRASIKAIESLMKDAGRDLPARP